MLKIVNTVLVVSLLAAAFVVYSLEYTIRRGEREIVVTKKKTRQAQETMRLLDAEWSMLTKPERLQRLSVQHLDLQPIDAGQMMSKERLVAKLPERPAIDPTLTKNDPIAKMLKGLN